MFKFFLSSVVLAFGLQGAFAQRDIPALSGPVIDEARLLSANERMRLEDELRAYPPAVQMQIWIVNSLEGEAIEDLSIRATNAWRLGSAKEDRGVLLIVAMQDRRSRLEIGQGLEGDITDLQANRIVDGPLRATFRDGRFFDGLLQSSREVYKLAGGVNATYQPQETRRRREGVSVSSLVIFLIFLLLMRVLGGRGGGRRSQLYGLGSGFLLGRASRGGFGGFGSGRGGGSWSGGGGFSGGGSSGSW